MAHTIEEQKATLIQDTESVPDLWPRFGKVRKAIMISTSPEKSSEVNKDFKTFSWGGVDRGIHDHSGSIDGIINNIRLCLRIKGSTVENQMSYYVDDKDNFRIRRSTETYAHITGNFISRDEMEGAVEIHLENGKPQYEAYWLSCLHGYLRLEQVVNSQGVSFDAENLDSEEYRKDDIRIPETDFFVPIKLPIRLTRDLNC